MVREESEWHAHNLGKSFQGQQFRPAHPPFLQRIRSTVTDASKAVQSTADRVVQKVKSVRP